MPRPYPPEFRQRALDLVLSGRPVPEVSQAQWDQHMSVNVSATFFLTRAAAEAMRNEGIQGRILIMSSGSWLSGGMSTRLPYATSKGAVTTMARSLAKEYGPAGICVNCIAPGLIDTAMMRRGLSSEQRTAMDRGTVAPFRTSGGDRGHDHVPVLRPRLVHLRRDDQCLRRKHALLGREPVTPVT